MFPYINFLGEKMIYDITQPLFECEVFPGDSKPERKILNKIKDGDICNLTALSMCVHNGTHIDSPYHFYDDGIGVDKINLEKFIGPAFVKNHNGNVTESDAKKILEQAKELNKESAKRILIKGKAVVTLEAAKVFADADVYLLGNESQTVGPEDAPAKVHLVLLKKEIVLLEGIRLEKVPDGVYMLNCAPLNLTDCDGSPCRAILMDL